MKFTESIGITTRNMHVKFEAVQRSYNFGRKNAYSAGLSKQDEIVTFTQCSPKFMKLTEFIGITTKNMHVKFEAVWRCYNFLGKNADSTGPSKQNENLTFSQCSPKFMKLKEVIGITTRNMHVKFEAVRRSYNFWRKNAYSAGWNFDIFSMFSKIHETYRSYWNHHQKHACEIWGSSEKLQFLTEKCLQRQTLKTGWNLDFFSMFSKIHETYRSYWNHHQKHACEIWGSSEKLQFLTEKRLQHQTFKTGWSFDIFSMFSKIHEIYRIYWNHHQKHACEIWGSSEKLQFLTEKCLQRRTFKTGWNFDIFSIFTKIHEIYRIYWNHHQNHACEIWGSLEKLQFLTENADCAGP